MLNLDVYIFGAKATAAGLYRALSVLEPEKTVKAFLVSDCEKMYQKYGDVLY